MKELYGYLRVSTLKQGQGASLQEQQAAIERFAQKKQFCIKEWFTEKQTAAKQGRTVFTQVLRSLKQGKADGLVVHKIDRSARNLRDWANLGDLFDQGIAVYFAHDDLDMSQRSGRLSADIQAIVAADYVRNLREETKKGFYGRLKQGYYPLTAPVGYLDCGSKQVKAIDPEKAPLVKRLFELYASGDFSLRSLTERMKIEGLTSQANGALSVSIVHRILRNPFYAGVMKIQTTGETFPGNHQPIITPELFERVQRILTGGHQPVRRIHSYLFRGFFRCHGCGTSMIGEQQKGRVYYRCHTRECATKTAREDRIGDQIRRILKGITLPSDVFDALVKYLSEKQDRKTPAVQNYLTSKRLMLKKTEQRLERLADAYLDGVLEAEVIQQKRQSLLISKKKLEKDIQRIESDNQAKSQAIQKTLELLKNPLQSYEAAVEAAKSEFLKKLGSNFSICGRKVLFELKMPFALMAIQPSVPECAHQRYRSRKIDGKFDSQSISPIKESTLVSVDSFPATPSQHARDLVPSIANHCILSTSTKQLEVDNP